MQKKYQKINDAALDHSYNHVTKELGVNANSRE